MYGLGETVTHYKEKKMCNVISTLLPTREKNKFKKE